MTAVLPPRTETCETGLRRLVAAIPDSTLLRLDRREVVYGCSEREPCIYMIESGQVKVLTNSRDGKECLLGIYGPGDLIGEVCLDGGNRAETVVTMAPTVLRRFSRARFMTALQHSGLREEFVRYLAHRLAEQQQLITDFVTCDSEYRLASVLLHMGRKIGHRNGQYLVLDSRITQEELSGMVGTTRSRIGLFLKRFIDAGLVCRGRDGGLVIAESRLDTFMCQC